MFMERLTEQVMIRLTPWQRQQARRFAQEMSAQMNRRVTESEVIRHAVDVFFTADFSDRKVKGGDQQD